MAATTAANSGAAGTARERLLAAALTRIEVDGLVRVTLDEIRLEAGVSVGAMYHHFADKKALPKETMNYIPTILALTIIGKDPDKYGFTSSRPVFPGRTGPWRTN